MSPPGNGATSDAGHAGGREKKNTNDAQKIADPAREGKPQIVLDLEARNIPNTYRPAWREVVVACPSCGSKMAISTEGEFWICFGDIRCGMNRRPFEQVVEALAEKARTP